ncbi:MAG: YjbH domain-containing protein [Bacteroidales bacterium]
MKRNYSVIISFSGIAPIPIKGLRLLLLLIAVCFAGVPVRGQFSLGMSGGLNIPSALLSADGTFSAGGNYLPSQMMPDELHYNSGNYFFNIAFFSFMELNYRSTLLHFRQSPPLKEKYVWNKDRSVGIRFRILTEGKTWRPALSIGSNDVVTTGKITKLTDDSGGNRYFASVYGVATRTFRFQAQQLRLTAGYYIPFYKRSDRNGPFAGAEWIPARCCWLSILGEYDCKAVNLGVQATLFRHLTVQVFCYDFRAVSAGIRYSLNLLGKGASCNGY